MVWVAAFQRFAASSPPPLSDAMLWWLIGLQPVVEAMPSDDDTVG